MRPLAKELAIRNPVLDRHKRPLHDLRISVIDRCNFRCPYCMPAESPEETYHFLEQDQWLNFNEIVRLARIFVQMGVSKIRITGGEPLLRPGIPELISRLNALEGVADLALTTNGYYLTSQVRELKLAGLRRLTISLDTLNDETFRKMNGHRSSVKNILEGIQAAEDAGFTALKINAVIQRGVNDQDICALVEYFKGSGHILRFIEYMDVGNCNHWQSQYVVPSVEIFQKINAVYPLVAAESNCFGEVAKRYTFSNGSKEIGFVPSITQPFCATCTRARLSTDGQLFTCLFADHGTDIRTPLRQGVNDQELFGLIEQIWHNRSDRYSEIRSLVPETRKGTHKVEMFQIGG